MSRRVLLISDHRRVTACAPWRVDEDLRFTCCTADSRSLERVIQLGGEPYDWVLVDAAALGEERQVFLESLRALGRVLADKGRVAECRVEWDGNGTLRLCCARNRVAGQGAEPGRHTAGDADEIFVFEFQAPMERIG